MKSKSLFLVILHCLKNKKVCVLEGKKGKEAWHVELLRSSFHCDLNSPESQIMRMVLVQGLVS